MTTSTLWASRISLLSLHIHLIHYGVRRRFWNHVNQATNQTERVADGLGGLGGDGVAVLAHRPLGLPRIVHVVVHLRRLPVGIHCDERVQEGEELILAILRISGSDREDGSFLLAEGNFEGSPKIRELHARFIPAGASWRG